MRRDKRSAVAMTVLAEGHGRRSLRTSVLESMADDMRRTPAEHLIGTADRGDEIHVTEAGARLLEGAGLAVRVQPGRMGKKKVGVLLYLLERSAARRPSSILEELAEQLRADDGRSAAPSPPRVPWSPEHVITAIGPVVTSSALSQTLARLEEGGLIFRDAPARSGRRTSWVQLTQAGHRIALEQKAIADATP